MLCTSRQAGKSTVTSVVAVHTAISKPGALVLLIAPSMRQSVELYNKVVQVHSSTRGLPPLRYETRTGCEYETGSRIIALPGKPETIRGFSAVDLIIVDEAAFVQDQLVAGVRPMLAVSQGRMMMISTPFGRRGTFFETWRNDNGWRKIKVTADMVPRIDPAFLEEERIALGDAVFSQEYDAEFLSAETSLFNYDVIQAALDAGAEIERWF